MLTSFVTAPSNGSVTVGGEVRQICHGAWAGLWVVGILSVDG